MARVIIYSFYKWQIWRSGATDTTTEVNIIGQTTFFVILPLANEYTFIKKDLPLISKKPFYQYIFQLIFQ